MNGYSNSSPVCAADPGAPLDEPHATTVQVLSARLSSAGCAVLLSGAGLSTESGIPDYRGPNGTWTRQPRAQWPLSNAVYEQEPELRRASWQRRLHSPLWAAVPNRGHFAVGRLQRLDVLHWVVTQNVDELHQRAGSRPDRLIELHGSMRRVRCLSCGARTPMPEVLARVAAGDADPRCTSAAGYHEPAAAPACSGQLCGGVLQSDTVGFGEALDAHALETALSVVRRADVLIVAGSSLTVHPAASLVPLAAQHGAWVAICNNQPTPYDRLASLVVRSSVSALLTAVADALATTAIDSAGWPVDCA
ncbi:MAG: Sir2 family NAD-dependent protein deacetylase [Actinomycetota bacterium]|nr:Sir2 family NAD-dependent protein deacetylase [Actinomycetota bacterium]